LIALAGAGLAIGFAACGGSPTISSPPSTPAGCTSGSAGVSNLGAAGVKVSATDQLQFSPASQTASVGQVVEWTNTGGVTHTIMFDSAPEVCLSDAQLAPGATWEVKFTKPGTYAYRCTIHPGMTGSITVTP
jgi:plastocyanin